tara:strand:+ start:526 stop:1131 length:606 start_codon:yes stop_codon:yes gene_type:complete
MISRKKKILIIQFCLLISGIIIILFTYLNFNKTTSNKIISEDVKDQINEKITQDTNFSNVFYDIKYSGIDLSGNRYILNAKEASNSEKIDGVVNLKFVNATFFFKDNKILKISSLKGIYNNKTLDMSFEKDVEGKYDESVLFAEKADYFNSKNFLIISDNVKLIDYRGTISAEKLIFDIKKNTLKISSSANKKVNANINYK